MTWSGRRLSSYSKSGVTVTYVYNESGIRTQNTVDGTTTDYFLSGSTILAEKTGSNITWYLYDSLGNPVGYEWNGAKYWYITNLQGDILYVVNSAGTPIGSYTYSPYGDFTATVLSSSDSTAFSANHLTYRGYYYDTETGLYYLTSRYYDAEVGRFINADDTAYLGADGTFLSYNLFTYCKNNPVMGYDLTGHFYWKDAFYTAAVATMAALAVIAIVTSGGAAAPPLLAVASTLAGTTVTAAVATTVATSVATVGIASMGAAAAAGLLEATSKNNGNSRQVDKYRGKTTYNKQGERIDYEYYGNGNGNVHYQGTKGKEIIWRLVDGVGTMYNVSKAVKIL